jgi:putative membrane protein
VSSDDRDFAARAAQGGMAEVEMGNLAQQQGTSAQLKEYGRALVEDHTKLSNQLKDIAAKENFMLPTEMTSDERKAVDRLSKLSGPEFDKEFAKESVSDHKKDIDEFSKQARSGQDEALKTFAANTIPVLEKHLNMAENVEQGKPVTSRK